MTYKEYVENRGKLMQEAKNLMTDGKIEEFNDKKKEIESLDKQWEDFAQAKANLDALENKTPKENPLIDLSNGEPTASHVAQVPDIYDTKEYVAVFKDYVCKSVPIPDKYRNAAEKTTTSDTGAVIPTTLVREIIKEMKSYGNIYSKVRKLNVQGGVEFPILTLKPEAKWIGEGASEDQKIAADDKVSFSYYGLECKIAQSLLASVVTIEEFQAQFTSLATEAIIEALDVGIIKGTGTGQMLGITKDPRVPTENVIELTEVEFDKWQTWKKKVFAKMKKSYRDGIFLMAQSTFDGHIDAMVDANGQPIGRVNYGIDGAEVYRFGGKTVETVEENIIADFDTAAGGEVVAVFVKLSNYAINSNMEMRTVKWEDHDTNEVKNKLVLIVDGKLIDPYGVLIIKKKATA